MTRQCSELLGVEGGGSLANRSKSVKHFPNPLGEAGVIFVHGELMAEQGHFHFQISGTVSCAGAFSISPLFIPLYHRLRNIIWENLGWHHSYLSVAYVVFMSPGGVTH